MTDRSASLVTLRQRLLQHVLTPLFVVWCLGTATTVGLAYYFTLKAFDRALLDDAFALSAQVHLQNGEPTLDLSARELASLLFDKSEKVFFAVQRRDGSLLAGDNGLTAAVVEQKAIVGDNPRTDTPYAFADGVQLGSPVRKVTLAPTKARPWTTIVAQTSGSRSALIERLLLFSVVPQVLLLMALAVWLLTAIGRDLAPLNRLHLALQKRDATDLSPIPAAASSRDVAQLTDAANALLARIQQGIQAQREFTGNVAHELRNPLAGIRALAQYGLRQSDPVVLREQLQAIAKSEVRASHLIDQLLALALADEAREQMALTEVSLNEVVEDCVADLMQRLRQSGGAKVELTVSGLDQPVSVLGSESMLKGCLTNLLNNALAYGEPGDNITPHISIEVHPGAHDKAGRLMFSVVDNGPGLAPDLAESLQLRWTRGQGSERAQGGAGLGLAIVARYAELMGATFTLDKDDASGGLRASLALRQVESPLKATRAP
jgi:two-component system, OmpR family, sensor histidine kinase TctE